MIDDPLQNILHAAYMVLYARGEQAPGNWLAVIGEMDWVTEIHRTMKGLQMRPDFIIAEKHTAAGSVFIVLPTNTMAQNWLFARVTATERRQLSAHLDHGRYAEFQSDAAVANLKVQNPSAAVPASETIQ